MDLNALLARSFSLLLLFFDAGRNKKCFLLSEHNIKKEHNENRERGTILYLCFVVVA